MPKQEILVTTHVGRDILQASQLFRTLEAAVWEYIVNGLEYVDPGVRPEIQVRIETRSHRIVVADNGRGMSAEDLQHFFTMHGENRDRRRGVPGRGKFGTGKSAAFGIGKRLEVATVRNEVRNVVELERAEVERSEGGDIPTNWLVRNQTAPNVPNGTVVTVDGISIRRMGAEPLIRLVERHLAFWRAVSPRVAIGTHVCSPWEPDVASVSHFTPPAALHGQLSDIDLTVRASRVPLDEGYRGVAVTAGQGNLVAVETAGVDSKEFGNYLFGDVDVPRLEEPADDGTLLAYDSTRSLQLNYSHPVAAALVGFIGSSLEQVRKGLVEEHRKVREQEDSRRLSEAAKEIEDLLNKDLAEVSNRLNEMRDFRKRTGAISRAGEEEDFEEPHDHVVGKDVSGLLDRLEPRDRSDVATEPTNATDPGVPHGTPDPEGTDSLRHQGHAGDRKRRTGGLQVEFANLGKNEERSHYDADHKVILINLDHPMVSAAKGVGGVEDVAFRRLSYEIAFTQYALALAKEVYERDPDITADDALFEVRDALRRVTSRGAALYSRL
jgi:hypothetical protein